MSTSTHNHSLPLPSATNHIQVHSPPRPKLPFLAPSSSAPSSSPSSDSTPKLKLSAIAAKLITGVHPTSHDVARDRWASSSPECHLPRPSSNSRPKPVPLADPARSVTASVFAAAKQERAANRPPLGTPARNYPNHRHSHSHQPPDDHSPRHHHRSHTQADIDLQSKPIFSPARSTKGSAPAALDGTELEDEDDIQLSELCRNSHPSQTKENEPPGQSRKKIASPKLARPQSTGDFVAVAYAATHRGPDPDGDESSQARERPFSSAIVRKPVLGRSAREHEPNPMREMYLAQATDKHGRVENEKQRVAREFDKLLDAMQITAAVRTKMNSLDHPVKSAMLKSSTSACLAKMIGTHARSELAEEPKPESKEGSAWWAMYLKSHNFRELVTADVRRLRVALRTQPPGWTAEFVGFGGYNALLRRLKELVEIEWREEQHDDQVLFEILRCFKALLLTDPGRKALGSRFPDPFVQLTNLLYSEKKPGDLASRQVLLELIQGCFEIEAPRPEKLDWNAPIAVEGPPAEGSATAHGFVKRLLIGPPDQKKEQIVEFVTVTHRARPFKTLVNEFVGVLMDYFWVFCHAENQFWDLKVIDQEKLEGPKVPSGMTGGVEYEAMSYCTAMMKLINQLIKTSPDSDQANQVHSDLFESGFERCLVTLRKSSTTYYPMVHLEISRYLSSGIESGFEFPYSIMRHLSGYQAF